MRKLLIAAALLFSLHSFSQTNWVGKEAPELNVDKWIDSNKTNKDLFITDFEKSDVDYIILEFWAPDVATAVGRIPLLNEIAEEFNNVQILSVTPESDNQIQEFLGVMPLNYPVGIDTSGQTISNYNIHLYPTTLIINRNGIIIWQDDFHFQSLNKYALKEIINGEQLSVRLGDNETQSEEDQLYSFSINEHHLNMGKASSSESGPYLVSMVNKDLDYMLSLYWHINSSRVLNYDSAFLKKRYDVNFQASKNIPIEDNCTEAIKWLLPKELNFQPQPVKVDTSFYSIQVINDSILNGHLSVRNNFGGSHNWDYSSNDTVPSIWKAKGATLSNLRDYLENQFNVLVKVENNDSLRYNFNLSLLSMNKNIVKLQEFYGISLVEKKGSIEMWKIFTPE